MGTRAVTDGDTESAKRLEHLLGVVLEHPQMQYVSSHTRCVCMLCAPGSFAHSKGNRPAKAQKFKIAPFLATCNTVGQYSGDCTAPSWDCFMYHDTYVSQVNRKSAETNLHLRKYHCACLKTCFSSAGVAWVSLGTRPYLKSNLSKLLLI